MLATEQILASLKLKDCCNSPIQRFFIHLIKGCFNSTTQVLVYAFIKGLLQRKNSDASLYIY